jgi:phenylacetate-CoA ligase
MIVDEGVIVEIVRPGTGDPVPEGEVGEVVVTTLNPDYPLIRFATGDLSAVMAGTSPCGRTNIRIKEATNMTHYAQLQLPPSIPF